MAIYCPLCQSPAKTTDKPCKLYNRGQRNPRIILGGSKKPGGVLIVGEAPGYWEDMKGVPFVGDSGKLLRDGCARSGIPWGSVTTTNVVCCRPPGNANPPWTVIKLCSGLHLGQVIDDLKPVLIIAAGASALKGVFGARTAPGITRVHGIIQKHPDKEDFPPILPIYHPAYVLRNKPALLKPWLKDLEKARDIIAGTYIEVDNRWPVDIWYPKDPAEYPELIRRLDECDWRLVSYDVETTGLNPWSRERVQNVLTLSLSPHPQKSIVIPFGHPEWPGWETLQCTSLIRKISRILNNPACLKVAHNAKFDDKWLKHHLCIDVQQQDQVLGHPNQADTMLAKSLVEPDGLNDLDYVTMTMTDGRYGNYWEEVQALTAKDKDYSKVPLATLCQYNGYDTMVPIYVLADLLRRLKEANQYEFFFNSIMRFSYALRRTEEAGMTADLAYAGNLVLKYVTKVNNIKGEFLQIPEVNSFCIKCNQEGKDFNLRSTAQLGSLLYDHLGAPKIKKTKSQERWSVDSDTRKNLVEHYKSTSAVRKVCTLYDDYSEKHKFLSTYLKPIGKHVGDDGRIHATFKLHRAVTGRLACADPNLQNIPADARPMYVSRWGDQGVILSVDFSGIEFRVLACISQDKALIEIFRNPNLDIHCQSAHLMDPSFSCGVSPHKSAARCEDCAKKGPRQRAKSAVSFGLMYGRSAEALAADLGIPVPEAEKTVEAYFSKAPGIREYWYKTWEFGRLHGYVSTMFGRRRYFPDLVNEDEYQRAKAEREAVNSPVQGTASDVNMAAMDRCVRELEARGFLSVPVNTVHDSNVFDVWLPELEEVKELVVRNCEDISMYPWAIVPFPVDLVVGPRWTK